jgi:hypothetical protein
MNMDANTYVQKYDEVYEHEYEYEKIYISICMFMNILILWLD